MNFIQNVEPVMVRNLVVAVLAFIAPLVPSLDVGTVEGVVMGVLALVLGWNARAQVTPVAKVA